MNCVGLTGVRYLLGTVQFQTRSHSQVDSFGTRQKNQPGAHLPGLVLVQGLSIPILYRLQTDPVSCKRSRRQRLHGTGSVWNRYKIGTDKACVYTGPGESGTDRICYLVQNGSTFEGDPM